MISQRRMEEAEGPDLVVDAFPSVNFVLFEEGVQLVAGGDREAVLVYELGKVKGALGFTELFKGFC